MKVKPGEFCLVPQGECVESVAYAAGHLPETLWEAAENAELRAERASLRVLHPGDLLWVPELRPREDPGALDARHRFRRKGVPTRLEVVVRVGDTPVADAPYRLQVDGAVQEGRTDGDGRIRLPIMPDAETGTLEIDSGWGLLKMQVGLRALDPVTEMTGIQGRLRNLGYYRGPLNGLYDLRTARAALAFRAAEKLPPAGEPDDALRARLLERCGC